MSEEHRVQHAVSKIFVVKIAVVAAMLGVACSSGRPSEKYRQVLPPQYSVARPGELPAILRIPLRRQGEHLMVQARVNGVEAGWFLFDLGSSVTGIESGLGKRLKLPTTGKGTIVGIGGPEEVAIRRVEHLAIGGLEVARGEVMAPKFVRMNRSLGTPLSGVVGFPAIASLPFSIDYRTLTLTIYRPDQFKAPLGVPRQRLRVYWRLPMVSALIGPDRLVWLILDTGADNEITLPLSVLHRWPNAVAAPLSGTGYSLGVGGSVQSVENWLKTVKLFELDLRQMPVTFEPPPPSLDHPWMIIGRVGNKLLQNFRVTIDAREGWVWAEWLPVGGEGA